MNFYLRFIEMYLVPKNIKGNVYFFTTYFYSLLEKNFSYQCFKDFKYSCNIFKSLVNYDSVKKVN